MYGRDYIDWLEGMALPLPPALRGDRFDCRLWRRLQDDYIYWPEPEDTFEH